MEEANYYYKVMPFGLKNARVTYQSDGTPLAKGPFTRSMAKQIQEELATSSQGDAKLLFTWAIMEHF